MPRARVLPRPLTEPHPERLSPVSPVRVEILRKHELAMALNEPGYKDPETGLFVFTAKELAGLGRCCAMSCRHCPFKR